MATCALIWFHSRVTPPRRSRICEAKRPQIAAFRAQTCRFWEPNKGFLNGFLTCVDRTPAGARMLRQGYIPHKTYDFFVIADRLAQLLHCLMETVACPIEQCADADSRAGDRQRFDDVEVMTRVAAVPQTI